jgi:type I restriction enzyme S subunit
MSADFLRTIITSQSFQHELLTRQVVSAQPGIYLGDLAKVPIIIPTSLVEMNNLSSLLKQLDEAIALQQHRVELLNKFKHGYLQKLFI